MASSTGGMFGATLGLGAGTGTSIFGKAELNKSTIGTVDVA